MKEEKNLLPNGIIHFVFRLSQLSEIAFKSYNSYSLKKRLFRKGLAKKLLFELRIKNRRNLSPFNQFLLKSSGGKGLTNARSV